jgi:predicted  nucleic acid-binding Zn-ribbon protein
MIIENKETKRLLDRKDHDLEEALRSNSELNLKVNDLQAKIGKTDQLVREVDFLNEQLQDANLYIQGLISIVNEKETLLSENISARKDIEQRLEKMGTDLKDRAMLDVKSAILERELNAAHQRIKDLETLLVTEENKRKPLEDEIVELKSTLEKVHSSLAQIRLKAKREAYGL